MNVRNVRPLQAGSHDTASAADIAAVVTLAVGYYRAQVKKEAA